ncbi:MAG TPA: hypothetical protein VKZ79_18310 [Alphaproteobacteria bacterium]|nr:hypothetical protein [Alphaproteobacteria bacterium]
MPRKLKVYQTSLGFYDSVVAAPSQAAAARAWGADPDLFRRGTAREADDPQAIEAALAHPETPLRRAVGSSDPFSLKPKPPKASDIIPGEADQRPAKTSLKRSRPVAPPPPDRSELDAAEAVLRKLDEKRHEEDAELARRRQALDREEADLARRRQAMDEEEASARDKWKREREDAQRKLDRERRAYRNAGGKD